MQRSAIRGFLTTWCLVTGALSMAAVTVNGSGSYSTITEALNVAPASAVVEITDSGTYAENVHITVNGITLRAATGQTPTIQGIAAAHPVAPGSMPNKWHGGDPDTTFNTNGAAVVNSGTGVTLQGLTINAGAADGALDLRFGTATVTDVTIDATGKPAAVMTLGNQTIDGMTVNGSDSCISAQGDGLLTITDSTFNGEDRAAHFLAGTANVSNSTFVDNAPNTYGVVVGDTYGDVSANFDHVVFRSEAIATSGRYRVQLYIDGSGPVEGGNMPGGQWSDGEISFVANNCDFIAARVPGAEGDFLDNYGISVNTGRVGWIANNVTVTNSNFYGQYLTPINLGGSINEPNPPFGIRPDEITVENNYFYKTVNNITDQCDVLGNYGWCANAGTGNVQAFGPWDGLYVDADNGDFHVASDSLAATAASNGGPTGALGLGGTAVKTWTERTVAQSGPADFTSIQAAYDAANAGDVITILDSATYNENLVFETKRDITLRSAPGLPSRPVVSGTATLPSTLRIATAASQRVTIIGINFESANLASGSDAIVITDGGQTLVKDCDFASSGVTDRLVLMNGGGDNRSFINCNFNHQTAGFGLFINGTGLIDMEGCTINSTSDVAALVLAANLTLDFDNVTITAKGTAIEQRHGTSEIRDSHLKSNGAQVYQFTGNNTLTFRNFFNILECAGPQGSVTDQMGIARTAGTGAARIVTYNGDIYGGTNGTVGIQLINDTDRATVKNTIISKFATGALQELAPTSTAVDVFAGYAATAPSPSHNVLVDAPNLESAAGPNTVVATSPVSLYVNAPADFALTNDSIALGVNSGQTVTYAGSQGPAGTSSVSDWQLF